MRKGEKKCKVWLLPLTVRGQSFFLSYVYLAVSSISCGMRDLHGIMGDLSLCHLGLVASQHVGS